MDKEKRNLKEALLKDNPGLKTNSIGFLSANTVVDERLEVKIKLGPNATMPSYANDGDAGMDLVATSAKLNKNGCLEMGTEVYIEIPAGHVGLIFPRSSISKKNMSLTNSVGVIDSGYRGEIKFMFKASMSGIGAYEVGDKIGQLIIMPYPKVNLVQVDELDDTERGEGGFGSSDG